MAEFLSNAWPFAAAVLVVLGIVALVFLCIILFRASKTLKSVQNIAEEAEKEIAPALAKVNPMVDKAELLVDTVNIEILRVDSILEDVEKITDVAGKTATTVDNVASAPAEAVTSLVDRLRGSLSTKRADKLKQSRVVFPIGAGNSSEDAEEVAHTIEKNEETIEAASEAVAQAHEDKEDATAASEKPAKEPAAEADESPAVPAAGAEDEPAAE